MTRSGRRDGRCTRSGHHPGHGRSGWYLDDEDVGRPFLERVRALGPRIVCAHKGIAGPVANRAPASASPRDVGPAAAAFPDVTFVVYHSGYDIDPSEEGAHPAGPAPGVSRLVTSLADAGVRTRRERLRRARLDLVPHAATAHRGGPRARQAARRRRGGPDPVGHRFGLVRRHRSPSSTRSARSRSPSGCRRQFGYPALTDTVKAKILGLNAARLYDVDVDAALTELPHRAWLTEARAELRRQLA